MNMPFKKRFGRLPIWPALLSALVAPGFGQLANKELKKGFLLLAVFLGSFIWFTKVVTEQLSMLMTIPVEQWAQDPNVLKEAITKMMNINPDMFFTFHLLMLVLWTYSVFDAYVVARRRNKIVNVPLNEDSDPLS
jgi:hypothetical protein